MIVKKATIESKLNEFNLRYTLFTVGIGVLRQHDFFSFSVPNFSVVFVYFFLFLCYISIQLQRKGKSSLSSQLTYSCIKYSYIEASLRWRLISVQINVVISSIHVYMIFVIFGAECFPFSSDKKSS